MAEIICKHCGIRPAEVYGYCRPCWDGDSLEAEMMTPSVVGLVVLPDSDYESPREWSNVGTIPYRLRHGKDAIGWRISQYQENGYAHVCLGTDILAATR